VLEYVDNHAPEPPIKDNVAGLSYGKQVRGGGQEPAEGCLRSAQ
jgi:hypothetical protein